MPAFVLETRKRALAVLAAFIGLFVCALPVSAETIAVIGAGNVGGALGQLQFAKGQRSSTARASRGGTTCGRSSTRRPTRPRRCCRPRRLRARKSGRSYESGVEIRETAAVERNSPITGFVSRRAQLPFAGQANGSSGSVAE